MNSATNSNNKPSGGWSQILLIPLALAVVPVYKLGKRLSSEAYKGFLRGLFNGLIGLALAGVAAFLTAAYVGWDQGYTVFLWFPATCLAWVLTFFIVWPAGFLYLLRPINDKLLKWTDTNIKEHVGPAIKGLVNGLKVLPGSGALWDFVEDKNVKEGEPKKGKWVEDLVAVISGIGSVALAGWIGYEAYGCVAGLIPNATLFTYPVVAVVAGVLAFWVPVRIFFQLLDHGDLPAAATALSAAAVYFGLSGLVVSNPIVGVPAAIGAVLLGIAYIYPAIHGLLKTGLVKWLLDSLKSLAETAYNEKDKDYRKFYGQAATIPAAIGVGALAFLALSFYGFLPVAVCVVVAVVTAVISYIGLGEILDDSPGNALLGLASAAGVAVFAYFQPHAEMGPWLFWSATAAAAALTFFVVYPLFYALVRVLTISWAAKPVGDALESAHKAVHKLANDVTNWWDKNVIEVAYERRYNKTEYRDFFLHLANAAILGLGIWQAIPLAAGVFGLPGWVVTAALAVLGFLVYLIIGRILLGVGASAIGWALSAALFLHVAYKLYLISPDYWPLAAIIASTVASLAFTVVIPGLLAVIRFPLDLLVRPWLNPILAGVYDACWSRFEVIFEGFVNLCKAVWDNFLGPIFGWVGGLFAGLIKAISDVWGRLVGRK